MSLRKSHDGWAAILGRHLEADQAPAEFQSIESALLELDEKRIVSLLSHCRSSFEESDPLLKEMDRVVWAMTTVALIPRSLEFVALVLRSRRTEVDYECHFSLFCYLDEVQYSPRLKPHANDVLSLVVEYVKRAQFNTAQAAWMAGDLLGGHWCVKQSLPALIELLASNNATAQRAALHGLEEACLRSTSEAQSKEVRSALSEATQEGAEFDIRRTASELIERHFGLPQ